MATEGRQTKASGTPLRPVAAMTLERILGEIAREPVNAKVYFVRRGDFIKIGCTTDPEERLTQLRYRRDPAGRDGPVQVLLMLDGGRVLEGWMHERFADSRCEGSGEWFHADVQVLGFVAHMLRSQLLMQDLGLEGAKQLLLGVIEEATDGQATHT